jgi:hypothetical protein
MRPSKLPSDAELLKKEAAGLSHAEIAAEFGVTRQAVTKRFNLMDRYARQEYRDVAKVLPWDLASLPAKDVIHNDESFMGLRAFVRQRMGAEVSARSRLALRTFMNHVEAGEVLTLDPVQGVRWVSRGSEGDEPLVIRWPEGEPRDDRTALFRFTPAQSDVTAE